MSDSKARLAMDCVTVGLISSYLRGGTEIGIDSHGSQAMTLA